MLKPQDVLVLLKLTVTHTDWTYAQLASSLAMSASETHAAVRRASAAGLYSAVSGKPIRQALTEFVVHGVPYVYHAEREAPTARGMPTGFAAPPLDGPDEHPHETRLVWPDAMGTTRGWSIRPLYTSAPRAAKNDWELYALLALVDELRIGRARERSRAADEIRRRLA
ncbi:MAG: hypothetical protein AAF845_16360 [Bacteroidota bacterium]